MNLYGMPQYFVKDMAENNFLHQGRNKPVHGRFRHTPTSAARLSLPETPA